MLAIGDPDWTLYAQIARPREGDIAKILKTVCTMKSDEMLQNPYGYTFIDIISYLNTNLPIPLQRVYGLANKCTSHVELEDIFYEYVRPKTAHEEGVQDCLFLLQRSLSTL